MPDLRWSCSSCTGVLEYVYHCWWRCRDCGRWHEGHTVVTVSIGAYSDELLSAIAAADRSLRMLT